MTRSFRKWPLAALVALLLAALAGPALAADTSLAGTWKLKLVAGGNDNTLALVNIENKDGKPAATLSSIVGLPPTTEIETRQDHRQFHSLHVQAGRERRHRDGGRSQGNGQAEDAARLLGAR